jgi:limonene-1,2-epoxide hydrolase
MLTKETAMGVAEDAERVVLDMLDTFHKHDAEALRPFFTDDVVYHNIPMDPAVGIEATIAFIDGFFGMFPNTVIETIHLAVRDNVVLTERIDTFTVGDLVAALPVMGTFEVRDGRICAWRDYFDLAQVTNMLSGDPDTT